MEEKKKEFDPKKIEFLLDDEFFYCPYCGEELSDIHYKKHLFQKNDFSQLKIGTKLKVRPDLKEGHYPCGIIDYLNVPSKMLEMAGRMVTIKEFITGYQNNLFRINEFDYSWCPSLFSEIITYKFIEELLKENKLICVHCNENITGEEFE